MGEPHDPVWAQACDAAQEIVTSVKMEVTGISTAQVKVSAKQVADIVYGACCKAIQIHEKEKEEA